MRSPVPEFSAGRAASDAFHIDIRGVRGQPHQVRYIYRRDHRSALEIGHTDNERVDCPLGAESSAAQELTSAHAHPRVNWIDHDPLAAETSEDAGIAPRR